MGSFIGHVVPGSFFFLFSCWWMYNVFYRYFYARRFPQSSSYRNVSSFPCGACKNYFPLESFLKILAVAVGMLGEFLTGSEDGHFTHIGNAQHMTMFFFFGLNGLVDLGFWRRWDLPPKLDYLSAIFAFAVEAFLFYNHLHGRSHMDVQVHMFLFYTISACVFCTFLEMRYPKQVLAALGRVGFTLLQGSWFYQVGFILYPPWGPKWDQEDHSQMMIITLMYTWHFGCVFVLMICVGLLIWYRVQHSSGSGPGPMYQMVDTNEDSSKVLVTNGHGRIGNGTAIGVGSHGDLLDSESEEA